MRRGSGRRPGRGRRRARRLEAPARRRRRRRTPRNRRRRPCAPSRASRGGARGRGRGARPRRAPASSRPRAGGTGSRSSAFPGGRTRRPGARPRRRRRARRHRRHRPRGSFPSPRCAGERGAGRRRGGADGAKGSARGQNARRPRTCAGPRARPLGEHEASGSGLTREARGFFRHDRVSRRVQDRRADDEMPGSSRRSRLHARPARGCSGRLGIDRRPGANEPTSLLVASRPAASRERALRASLGAHFVSRG